MVTKQNSISISLVFFYTVIWLENAQHDKDFLLLYQYKIENFTLNLRGHEKNVCKSRTDKLIDCLTMPVLWVYKYKMQIMPCTIVPTWDDPDII